MARKQLFPRDARIKVMELDDQGRGRGRLADLKMCVWGALPGERVGIRPVRRRRGQLEVVAEVIACAHRDRIATCCPFASRCGGCTLQHLAPQAQRAFKRARLVRLFEEIGIGEPEYWFADLTGPCHGYRRKARLGVRWVPGKKGVLVGFREQYSSRIADVQACRILVPAIGEILAPLRQVITELSVARAVPQLEVAAGEDGVVIVFRHLLPLTNADKVTLLEAGHRLGFRPWLQAGGPDTARPLEDGAALLLHYQLPEFGLRLAFHPLEFIQVNASINRALVGAALELLAPAPADRVLDLFCGLGNFTLPIATRCKEVRGMEASKALVARAQENAAANGIRNAHFEAVDLQADDFNARDLPRADLVLLDPPRSGAERICASMALLGPRRIVYISCNPETLNRDAALLCSAGYALRGAGIADMFPHTAHIESISVFDRLDKT